MSRSDESKTVPTHNSGNSFCMRSSANEQPTAAPWMNAEFQAAIESAKQVVSEHVQRLATVARQAGQQSMVKDQELAGCMDEFAATLGAFSGYLSSSEPKKILDDVERQLRLRPALLIGGAVIAGLAAAGAARAIAGSSRRSVPRASAYHTEPERSGCPGDGDSCHDEQAAAERFLAARQSLKMTEASE